MAPDGSPGVADAESFGDLVVAGDDNGVAADDGFVGAGHGDEAGAGDFVGFEGFVNGEAADDGAEGEGFEEVFEEGVVDAAIGLEGAGVGGVVAGFGWLDEDAGGVVGPEGFRATAVGDEGFDAVADHGAAVLVGGA